MSRNLQEWLQHRPLEHALLCTYHEQIQTLVRYVTSGLLFEKDPKAFFSVQVTPTLEQLWQCLTQTYGEQHLSKTRFDARSITEELLGIEAALRSDIEAALTNDPATTDPLEVVFCYPGFKATAAHRLAHILYRRAIPLLPRMIAEIAHQQTGIDIHPGADIGSHFFIDHGTGVVIGETAIIGKRVTLYQGVTLGAKRFQRQEDGTVVKGQARHPILEDGVTVYAGATILGRITIGQGSVIGGNVWLTESVPPKSRITQQHFLSTYFTDGDGI